MEKKKKKKKKTKTKSSKVRMIGKLKTKPQKMEMMKKALIPISFACSATLGTVPAMRYSTITFRLTILDFRGVRTKLGLDFYIGFKLINYIQS